MFDAAGAVVASSAEPLSAPSGDSDGGWTYGRGGPLWMVPPTDDGSSPSQGRHRNPLLMLILFLGVVALAVGVSAFPVARGLTRRLERLQAGVETLGAGDLAGAGRSRGTGRGGAARQEFNRAAARIEELVGTHRMLLANASHELRTPLSRIRLGLDLLEQKPDPKLKADLRADIAELDRLIKRPARDRLDAAPALGPAEEIDLQALAAEECARYDDCDLDGDHALVDGDPRLLRRLIRNLLENAERHGRPPVRVTIRNAEKSVTLRVEDGGNGNPHADRARIFTPFTRATGDERGAGLGLSLVRQIARLHGGDAIVADHPVTGRTGFEVTLPAKG